MQVKQDTCIGCEICLPFCPVGAIYMEETGKAKIDGVACTECGTCARRGVVRCPGQCFIDEGGYEYPRSIRKFFSDPMATHAETGVPGRGTEESKTNDVTGRVKRGEVGIGIELGRPYVGVWGKDIDTMTRALAAVGVHLEPHNPLTHLMEDRLTGACKPELLEARLISSIIEFTIPRDKLGLVLTTVMEAAEHIDTVFSLDLITCFDDDGALPAFPELENWGLAPRPNAKINLGMGRPLYREGAV